MAHLDNVKRFHKTHKGVTGQIYDSQVNSSKTRGDIPPDFTKEELRLWLDNDWLFNLLFNNWVNCGYISKMKPSLDRLDDYKPYSLSNLKIGTWQDNNLRSHRDMKNGINNKRNIAVLQYSKDGDYIDEFYSTNEAERKYGTPRASNIIGCCKGRLKSAYGFVWKYK